MRTLLLTVGLSLSLLLALVFGPGLLGIGIWAVAVGAGIVEWLTLRPERLRASWVLPPLLVPVMVIGLWVAGPTMGLPFFDLGFGRGPNAPDGPIQKAMWWALGGGMTGAMVALLQATTSMSGALWRRWTWPVSQAVVWALVGAVLQWPWRSPDEVWTLFVAMAVGTGARAWGVHRLHCERAHPVGANTG